MHAYIDRATVRERHYDHLLYGIRTRSDVLCAYVPIVVSSFGRIASVYRLFPLGEPSLLAGVWIGGRATSLLTSHLHPSPRNLASEAYTVQHSMRLQLLIVDN